MRSNRSRRLLRSLTIALLGILLIGCGVFLDWKSAERQPSNASDPFSIPGFPEYSLTVLSGEAEVNELYSYLRSDLGYDIWDRCSDRAHVWSYQMWRTKQINSGKVFLFYTATDLVNPNTGKKYTRTNTGNPAGRSWVWHVAPYVVTEAGDPYVLEKFSYMNTPLKMADWLSKQANGAKCVELQGTEKELSQYTCGPLNREGTCTNGRKIRVPEGGAPCYFRRVPMYYYYPRDVANHDYVGVANRTEWSKGSPYSACLFSLSGSKGARRRNCSTFVQNPMASFTSEWIAPANAPAVTPIRDASNPVPNEEPVDQSSGSSSSDTSFIDGTVGPDLVINPGDRATFDGAI